MKDESENPAGVPVRAIRGATTVAANDADDILAATRELLEKIINENTLTHDAIISVIFTATEDITAAFPAKAARQIGLDDIPLLCCRELAIDGALDLCIRVMLHVWMPNRSPVHVYLRNAVSLRKDLAK